MSKTTTTTDPTAAAVTDETPAEPEASKIELGILFEFLDELPVAPKRTVITATDREIEVYGPALQANPGKWVAWRGGHRVVMVVGELNKRYRDDGFEFKKVGGQVYVQAVVTPEGES